MTTPKQAKAITKHDIMAQETLLALVSTHTRTEAAEQLGISRNALYDRIDRYKLDDQLIKIPQEALSRLQIGSIKAANDLVSKVGHADPTISLAADKEVLDRVGVTKPANNTDININFNNHVEEQRKVYDL